jgi:hypothetical protein
VPYANRELRQGFIELVASVMPFDLVLDEHTADGQEVRVAKTSVAGDVGGGSGQRSIFCGSLRRSAASVEGTTISYELVRRNASFGPPEIVVTGTRRHQQLAVARKLEYFGFQLETDIEALTGRIPEDLLEPAREALVGALLAGETGHSDQHRIRRGSTVLLEWWRRSGGSLAAASEPAIRDVLRGQLGGVRSWKEFLDTPLSLEPESLVGEAERRRLDALPSMIRLHGDAVPLEYEVVGEAGVVRLRLREGQARRLTPHDLPSSTGHCASRSFAAESLRSTPIHWRSWRRS